MKETLEDRLRAARGPAMPAAVEARLRQRLEAEPLPPPRSRSSRFVRRGSYGQLLLLLALLLTAGWVFRHNVAPVLRAAWERAHCLVEPGAGKP